MSETHKTGGAVLINVPLSPILRRGLDRIRKRCPDPVDMLHNRLPADLLFSDYDWVVLIDPLRQTGKDSAGRQAEESWEVAVSCGDPACLVTISSVGECGRLYALYHIAACLEQAKDPADWAVRRTPLLEKRYAWVAAGNCWYDVHRPDLFEHDLQELPEMGFNGMILLCNEVEGTSAGRQNIPLSLTADGVTVNRYRLRPYLSLFDRIKSYGLDICLFHQAFIPPQYSLQQVNEYYNGQCSLPDFEKEIVQSSRALAAALFEHLPQVDSLMFHAIECEWFWGHAAAIFPSRDNAAAERVFRAYLDGMTAACRDAGRDLFFWTHVSGVSPRQLRLMREILLEYPEVMVIEDQAHENECWPHCPVMGHVPPDLIQAQAKGRFGLAINTTDGEYYGGGSLPTAYPEPHINAARTALDLGMEVAFVRLNEQSTTPLGTLLDINAIHVLGVSETWWEPSRPLDELWLNWCTRRFGVKAAGPVAAALQKSGTIITRGLSAGSMALINHNGLKDHIWRPGANWAWELFEKPGELLVDSDFDDLRGCDIRAWQVQARGITLDDFLTSSTEGEAAAREAIELIESARAHLSSEDYTYLKACFSDVLPLIEAVRTTAVAVHAASRFLKTGDPEQKEAREEACSAMDSLADRIEAEHGPDFLPTYPIFKTTWQGRTYSGYGLPIALHSIAENFRNLE